MNGRRIPYSRAELRFVERRKDMFRKELHAAFVARFGRADVSVDNLKQLCQRNGWFTPPRKGRTKGRARSYSKDELAFIKRRQALPRRALHAAFVERFGRSELSLHNFKQLCKRNGLRTGRTGRFEKGVVPANKGKKMPFNANSARTQFKKGQQPSNTKHAGHERVDKDGYVWISVDERNPHTGFERRYVHKHRWLWQQKHGPIPDGMVLKCKGEKSNCDPSNWELVPRELLPRLNNRWGRRYDDAPAELKPTILAVAKLERAIHDKRPSKGGAR